MKAWNLTREAVHYRHDAFSAGLKAAGFEVLRGNPVGAPGNVLVIWNRYTNNHEIACRFEAAGGVVMVAENGYLGPRGISPHGMNPREWFAVGRGYHNDDRVIATPSSERWRALGVDLVPWRADGKHVLILPNRSFGTPGRIMPHTWAEDTRQKLSRLTKREIRVRPHPGNDGPKKPLADDLAGAWAVVIWSSSAGVAALVAGIPVISVAPNWICKSAAGSNLAEIENPPMLDRLPAMERLAAGQWSVYEIARGEPFRVDC